MKNNRDLYLLLTHSGSVLSRMIKGLSGAPYSHISIGIDPTFQRFYTFGRKQPFNPFWAGFVEEDLRDGIYAHFEKASFALYRLPVEATVYNRFQRELKLFSIGKNRYRYNLMGIVTARMGYELNRSEAFFCSQFVATLLALSGVQGIEKPAGLIHPVDFLSLPGLEKIAEGQMMDFRSERWDCRPRAKVYR